jgi:hypothetical protein
VRSVCRVKRFSRGGKRFADDEVETEVRKWLWQQSKKFYAVGFDALVKRRDKCINVGGGYVEKCSFLVRISHLLRFLSICGLFTVSPSYIAKIGIMCEELKRIWKDVRPNRDNIPHISRREWGKPRDSISNACDRITIWKRVYSSVRASLKFVKLSGEPDIRTVWAVSQGASSLPSECCQWLRVCFHKLLVH